MRPHLGKVMDQFIWTMCSALEVKQGLLTVNTRALHLITAIIIRMQELCAQVSISTHAHTACYVGLVDFGSVGRILHKSTYCSSNMEYLDSAYAVVMLVNLHNVTSFLRFLLRW